MFADTARLVASLEMRDAGFSKTADQASRKLKGLDASVARIGAIGKQGLSNLGRNLSRIGIGLAGIAAVGVTAGIKSGIDSLITLENATKQVTGALNQMGLKGRVTASQIARWANEIESSVDAAFDDKDILAASANLIRYGNIGSGMLREVMVVATDLAAKMGGGEGSVQSASIALAKSLANPLKATRLLAAAGVNLAKGQAKRLKNMMEEGRLHKAQAFLIDLVRKKTDGAANSLNGKTADAMNNWNDALEGVNQALATGFLPLMTDVANFLSTELAKDSTISRIREIGTNLSDAARSAFEFGKKIPWSAIGDGLGKAAQFAGNLFDVFRSMPPEVQTTLIALAGLDRLSGGAISGIVSELGKGLIKGVLGMTAAVVNLRAARVTGLGGVGGGPDVIPGETGGKGSRLGSIVKWASRLLVVGLVAELAAEVKPGLQGIATELHKGLGIDKFWRSLGIPEFRPQDISWPFGPKDTPTIFPELGGNGLLGGTPKGAPGTDGPLHNRGTVDRNEVAAKDHLGKLIELMARKEAAREAGNDRKAERITVRIANLRELLAEANRNTDNPQHGPKFTANRERESIQAFRDGERTSRKGLADVKGAQDQSLAAFRSGERTSANGLATASRSAQVAGVVGASATRAGASQVTGAINALPDPSLTANTTVIVTVTPGSIQRSVTTETTFGNSNASSGGGRNEKRPD